MKYSAHPIVRLSAVCIHMLNAGFRQRHVLFPLAVLISVLSMLLAPSVSQVLSQRLAAAQEFVGSASTSAGDGYWLVRADGSVSAFGTAHHFGDMSGRRLNKPIVGIAAKQNGNGYWLVASDGGIFSFGDAQFHGSTGAITLNKPVVSMTSTLSGNGYWLVASDGGIFSFGDAQFHGSTGAITLNKPVVSMTSTLSGNGYWLVASDGGIFSFGDAQFHGSTGAINLNKPIIGIRQSIDGNGYWLVASDGGVFCFGSAPFNGSAVGTVTKAVAIVGDGAEGYRVIGSTGSIATLSKSGTNGWELEYMEDFSGTSLNTDYWSTYYGAGNSGVGLRRPSAVRVGDGELKIVGIGDVSGGLCWCGDSAYDKTYGRWELRARMDKGNGYGPAALLWPGSENWPEDGEIDISEIPFGDRRASYFTLHWGADNDQQGTSSQADFSEWHTFGVDWQPGHITYYLDGEAKRTYTNAEAIPRNPMHLALQNDIGDGSGWIPARDGSTPAEVTYHVDWVKMYR